MLALLFWPLFCALLGYAQGRLLPTLRTVAADSPDARRNNTALHDWLYLAYYLPLLLVALLAHADVRAHFAAAAFARALVFDPSLNVAAGSPLFYVGATAFTDKLLRRLSPAHPERLRALLWLVALLLALYLYLFLQ